MRKKLLSLLVLLMVAVTGAVAQTTYKVSVKEGTEDAEKWTIEPTEAAAGTQVTVTYSGLKKVKSVRAKKAAAPAPSYDNTLNINTFDPELNNWEDVTVPTGKHWLITGTGEATTNAIIIENNATVTLSGVNITAWAHSITCVGNATIILADGTTNNLYAADEFGAAGIEMSGGSGTSLTIQGNTGMLNITSGSGPAIGAGYGHAGCAINIEGGIINATSTDGPGIGAAYNTACGNITISGGTVAATGGYGCPGIGGAGSANCGDITITNGVTSVTATKGSEAPYSIGASSSGSCGTVTIGGVVGAITESPFTYPASAEPAVETETVTWDLSEMSSIGYFYLQDGLTYEGVTLSGNPGAADFADQRNIIANNGATFTALSGKKFTSIVVNGTWAQFTGDGWTVNDGNTCSTWTGSAESVAFTGQSYMMTTIVFTLEGAAAPAGPTLADVFTDGAVVGVAVKNTYDTYTVTGTYSGGSYTSYTKSSNDIEEVTMTKDGNNLVVWIKNDLNSECTLTFNTQDNTYTKSFKAGTGAAVWDLSEFVSITVNGTDITSSLTEDTPASEPFTTNQEITTYDGTHFTITCTNGGDSDGIQIGEDNTLTITAKNGETITKVEFHCGVGHWAASETTVTAGTLNWTNGSTTGSIDDVNATTVTMSNSNGG